MIIDTLSINSFIKYFGCMVSFTSENYVFSLKQNGSYILTGVGSNSILGGPNIIYTAIAAIFAACMSLKGKILRFLCL